MVRRVVVERRTDVRDVLAVRCERSVARYGECLEFVDDFGSRVVLSNPAAWRLRALRAGNPVDVAWWEVGRFLSAEERSEGGRWRVLADGRIAR
jgi:hypothetical protein